MMKTILIHFRSGHFKNYKDQSAQMCWSTFSPFLENACNCHTQQQKMAGRFSVCCAPLSPTRTDPPSSCRHRRRRRGGPGAAGSGCAPGAARRSTPTTPPTCGTGWEGGRASYEVVEALCSGGSCELQCFSPSVNDRRLSRER